MIVRTDDVNIYIYIYNTCTTFDFVIYLSK